MGALHKAMVYLGFSEDDLPPDPEQGGRPASVTQLHDVNDPRFKGPAPQQEGGTASMDLRMIQTVKPRSYNDAKMIGQAFREGIPIIINLTEMADADAKRLIDFAAGLSFGLRGSIERVTTAVFVLSPAHVTLGVDAEPVAAEQGFFNQS
jgi:cell division inhibitor SepF